jgi:hypothetical protein
MSRPSANCGVDGVRGKSEELAEERREARFKGRNMPAPGIDVLKYRMLGR